MGSLGCKDESGRPVDWFVAIKHNDGFAYSYLDAKSQSSFKVSSHSLDKTSGGSIVSTLMQVYESEFMFVNHTDESIFFDNNTTADKYSLQRNNVSRYNLTSATSGDIAYAFYNDEHPDGKKSTYDAHSKGVIAFDTSSGFWLIHSMPKWPNSPSKGYEGLPDYRYGQSFLCITMSTSQFDSIGQQQQMTRPYMYDSYISDSLASKAPGIADWFDGKNTETDSNAISITSKGGVHFKHIAKSRDWGKDLYEDLVAPELNADLLAETWQNGGGDIGAYCKADGKKYDVVDVKEMKLGDDDWTINQDHSKWAISTSGRSKWVCVGDINRQTSQTKRGGGTVCQSNSQVHGAFMDGVVDQDSC